MKLPNSKLQDTYQMRLFSQHGFESINQAPSPRQDYQHSKSFTATLSPRTACIWPDNFFTMAPAQTQDTPENTQKSSDLLEHSKGESVLTDKDRKALVFTDKHSSPDVYVNSSKDTLWHPWTGTLELKPLRFETRSGSFVIGLRTPVDCWLGKHRHRGTVTAVTLSGNWRYKE